VKTERSRYAKELQKYWQGVIKEREKENLVPAVASPNLELINFCCDVLRELENNSCAHIFYKYVEKEVFRRAKDDADTESSVIKTFLRTRSRMSLSSTNDPVLQAIFESLLPSRYRILELFVGNGRRSQLKRRKTLIIHIGEVKNPNYVTKPLKPSRHLHQYRLQIKLCLNLLKSSLKGQNISIPSLNNNNSTSSQHIP
ncbi:15900_t:CDS:2, partial [Funneliformis geosporum]